MKTKIIVQIFSLFIILMTGFNCIPKTGPDNSTKSPALAVSTPSETRQPTAVIPKDNLPTFALVLQEGKYDQVNSLIELPGNQYLLAGVTSSNETTGTDGYLVKIDAQGNKLEEHTYPRPGDQYFYNIVQASDSGYVIIGVVKTPGKEDWDIYAVKMDAQLKQVWEKSFGGAGVEDCNELIRTRDGGYVFAGHTDSMGKGKYDFYIVKMNRAGETQWEKTYGTEAPEVARTILQTGDDGYLVAGHGGPSKQEVLVIKLDSRGNEQWRKTIANKQASYANSMTQAKDGGFLLTGMSQYNVNEKQTAYQIYVTKIDAKAGKLWEKTYNYEKRMICLAQSIKQTLDGNYIIGGAAQHEEDVGFDIALIKIDPQGNELWKRTFNDLGGEYTNVALPVADGGYLVGGYTSKKVVQDDKGMKRVLYLGRYGYIVKFNSFGGLN